MLYEWKLLFYSFFYFREHTSKKQPLIKYIIGIGGL